MAVSSGTPTLQAYLTTLYPVLYGNDSWPLIIITLLYFICLILSAYELSDVLRAQRTFRVTYRVLFQLLLVAFLSLRVLFYLVPFPFTKFWAVLLYEALPRYTLCLAWQFLSLWLGQAIFPPVVNNLTEITSASIPTTITSLILYLLVLVTSITCGIGIIYILSTAVSFGPYTSRLWALFVLVLITIIVFFVRFIHAFLQLFDASPIHTFQNEYSISCADIHLEDCEVFYIISAVLYFVWELIPTFSFIIVYHILTRPAGSASKQPRLQDRESTQGRHRSRERGRRRKDRMRYRSSEGGIDAPFITRTSDGDGGWRRGIDQQPETDGTISQAHPSLNASTYAHTEAHTQKSIGESDEEQRWSEAYLSGRSSEGGEGGENMKSWRDTEQLADTAALMARDTFRRDDERTLAALSYTPRDSQGGDNSQSTEGGREQMETDTPLYTQESLYTSLPYDSFSQPGSYIPTQSQGAPKKKKKKKKRKKTVGGETPSDEVSLYYDVGYDY